MDHVLSDLSTMIGPFGGHHRAWLSFIELDKAVVCVIRVTSFLCLWFQCVCHLMRRADSLEKTLILGPPAAMDHAAEVCLLRRMDRRSMADRSCPSPRSGGVAVRRYPSSKVRSSGCVLLEQL